MNAREHTRVHTRACTSTHTNTPHTPSMCDVYFTGLCDLLPAVSLGGC